MDKSIEFSKKEIFGLVIVVWLLVIVVNFFQPMKNIEHKGFDWLSVLSSPFSSHELPIVVVGIDEMSFAEINEQWPWQRGLHAQLIESLTVSGAALIGYDIIFSELSNEKQDALLASAISKAKNIVLAASVDVLENQYVKQAIHILPLPQFLQAGAQYGFATVKLDDDVMLRKVPPMDKAFWRQIIKLYDKEINNNFSADENFIRYIHPSQSFQYVPFYEALTPNPIFDNKIVLVGLNLKASPMVNTLQSDLFATPFLSFDSQLTPGIIIHANLVANAMKGGFVKKISQPIQLVVLLLIILLSTWSLRRWSFVYSTLVMLCWWCFVFIAAWFLFSYFNYWLPFISLFAGIGFVYICLGGITLTKEKMLKSRIKKAFMHYVAPSIVEQMIAHPEQLVLGGERRDVSFIFTDIAGFTSLTEKLGADDLVAILHEYFGEVCAIILRYQGTIERIVGDGLVAMFNAPIDQLDHPSRAVQCALEIHQYTSNFSKQKNSKNVPFGKTRIGVDTGMVSVGNFGSNERFHYTAMGDPINTASRLESANKIFGTSICVSERTSSRCSDILFRPIGEVRLKRKEQYVTIFEPLANTYSDSLEAYLKAYRWLSENNGSVIKELESLHLKYPDDALIAYHFRRVKTGQNGIKIILNEK